MPAEIFSKITLTFSGSGLAVGEFLRFDIEKNGGGANTANWTWVPTRIAAHTVTDGIDFIADAVNYEAATNADLPGLPDNELLSILQTGNTEVQIGATQQGYVFSAFSTDSIGVSANIENLVPPTIFTIDTVNFATASSIPCSNVEATVTESNGVPPYTWIIPSIAGTTLIEDVVRSGLLTNLTLEDSTTAQASISVQFPGPLSAADILNITSVTNPSGFSATVTIFMNAVPGLIFEYAVDAAGPYQTENIFPSMQDGSFTAYIRDQYGCITSEAFEVDLAANVERPAELGEVSEVNSFEFKLDKLLPDNCNTFQNYDYLYDNLIFRGETRNPYYQLWQHCDGIRTQFRSNYDTLEARIVDSEEVELRTFSLTQVSNNLGLEEKRDCNLFNLGNNQTGMYFKSGNIYDPGTLDIIDSYTLNGLLPEWAVAGQSVTFTGSSIDASYQIKQTYFDATPGIESLIAVFDVAFPLSTVELAQCQVAYDRQTYESYEFDVNWKDGPSPTDTDLPDGKYQIQILMSDSLLEYNTRLFRSEWICLQQEHPDTVVMDYFESNRYPIDYSTGIEHRMRFLGLFKDPRYPYTDTDYRSSGDIPLKLKSVVREVTPLEIFDLPQYQVRKLSLALSMFTVLCQGKQVHRGEDTEFEPYERSSMYHGIVQLETQEFQQDRTDNIDLTADNFLLTQTAAVNLLKVT